MNDKEIAKISNDLFPNNKKTLDILKFDQSDPVSDKVNDTTLKTILKYGKQSSILTIKEKCKAIHGFHFLMLHYEHS